VAKKTDLDEIAINYSGLQDRKGNEEICPIAQMILILATITKHCFIKSTLYAA